MTRREGAGPARRRGFSVLELLIVSAASLVVLGAMFLVHRFARVSTDGSLAPQVGLQFTSRTALIQFTHQIQECLEIVRPAQGSSLNYFVARDKSNKILSVYTIRNLEASASSGRELFDLVLCRHDFGATPPEASRVSLVRGVERVTFTSRCCSRR